jgi:predicted nucleic acid-binding protein
MLIDTQILSSEFKGISKTNFDDIYISSVTANEFLWVYDKLSRIPNYYILNPNRYNNVIRNDILSVYKDDMKNKKWADRGSRRTDKIIIDFNNSFPPYVEYGSEAISRIINERLLSLFKVSHSHLEKKKSKYLQQRISYIFERDIKCISITEEIIEVTMEIFSQFIEKYTLKKDIHNSINDLIILATAICNKMKLQTRDDLLSDFATKLYCAKKVKIGNDLEINFQKTNTKILNREEKGYYNKGWSYKMNKGY